MRLALSFFLLASFCQADPGTPDPVMAKAFDQMYRRNYNVALQLMTDHLQKQPNDPLAFSVRAAAYLFSELDRLMILESDFFNDDKRILEKKKLSPDPAARKGVFDSIEIARKLSASALAANPVDTNALFAMCIATGVQTDYLALIEKRQLGSLSYAKESHNWALRLLKVDSKYYDAYLTTGLSEYILGSVPFFVRWFVKFDQTEGSKSAAVRNLELVAKNGTYFRPFAKLLLAIAHLREKRYGEAEMLLAELNREFPENALYKKELDRLVNRRTVTKGM